MAPEQRQDHCVKSVRIRSFSGLYFPAFGPEKLWIQTLFTQWIRGALEYCQTSMMMFFCENR